MLFVDSHRKLLTEEQEQSNASLQAPLNAVQGFSEGQIDFPPNPMWSREAIGTKSQGPNSFAPPPGAQVLPGSSSFGVMAPFVDSTPSPHVTGQLAEPQPQTGNLSTMAIAPAALTNGTAPLRQPVVIRRSKKTRQLHPSRSLSKNGRTVLSIFAVLLCLLLTGTAFAAVVPVDTQGHSQGLGKLLQPLMNVVTSKSNNGSSISIQEAEATAAATDGFDPASFHPAVVGASGSTLNRFFYGQCTYWANYRYHQLTGIWIPWLGNAYEWYGQAVSYGWHTSDYPNPNGPSIMVLGPYVQSDYSAYGHVAVVEKINGDGTVTTSNMHWPYVGVVSYVNFRYPVSGTHFIWAP